MAEQDETIAFQIEAAIQNLAAAKFIQGTADRRGYLVQAIEWTQCALDESAVAHV
jgi:hypothetical protein